MSCPGPGPCGSELRYIAAGPSTGGSGVPEFEGRCYQTIGQTILGSYERLHKASNGKPPLNTI